MLDCQLDQDGNARPKRSVPRIKGFREQYEIQRLKQQEKQGPDNWVVRKFAVGLVAGIFGYSYYVYVVRLCIPMIRMEDSRLGARAQGLAYLVVFHFLFVMFIWSYVVAVWTQPGYARDVVPKTDPPQAQEEYITVAGQPYEQQQAPRHRFEAADLYRPPRRHSSRDDDVADDDEDGQGVDARGLDETLEMQERLSAAVPNADEEDRIAETAATAGAFGPAVGTVAANRSASPLPGPTTEAAAPAPRGISPAERERCQSAASTTLAGSSTRSGITFPPKAHLHKPNPADPPSSIPPTDLRRRASQSSAAPSYLHFAEPPDDYEPPKRLAVERIPRNAPVLTEQYRYDPREGIVRPYRSHRCRHCAAVVLIYNFLQYSSAYTLFLFLTLLIAQTLPLGSFPSSRPYPGADGQQLAILALSFLFLCFTGSLFAAHTRLILRNMTTIEEIGMNRMRQRERKALTSTFGFWAWRAKRETRREWDKQWGRLGREGNLWWLGSRRANWEMVMGKKKIGWFLPIPARPVHDDGLSYKPNPRFSPEGHWRPRKEWPPELR
ncbi:hypothetical protein Rhopal_002217-T1 [Rhodotorula paludigena]|uniref:Protein S-acyltransferase n=1 Tax=Rhodotorula paludigena TaxID=86838 RepID=A0AAV5GGF3_9BASI|nr:hypothetical protein Rhopal_002217-T1 [Rhodotorula paludigena]